jgi:hypothetical protein
MTSEQTKTCGIQDTSDAGNKGFGGPQQIADLKPGFDEGQTREPVSEEGDHAFRRRERKDIPQGTLADRIGMSKKGD